MLISVYRFGHALNKSKFTCNRFDILIESSSGLDKPSFSLKIGTYPSFLGIRSL